eukprot:TRINITY_DN15773_c0_g1_i1.p1 TRINITY_DN15773_c0_g1~~TRINITY_DN15773_c0_g1_i1.p1  ORF type:complete len:243 (-),score=53.51 TRINITY_DN15773_c0_g1_i1:502-1230(-)
MTSLFTQGFTRKVVIPETKGEQGEMPATKEQPTTTASQPETPRSPLTPLTPLSMESSSTSGSTLNVDPNIERGMVVHQHEKERGMVVHYQERAGTALMTVRSMSNEERNKLAHLEVSRKMEAAHAVHAREAEIFVEKSMRDALAEQYHTEAKAEKKFEEEMSSIKYKEAQLRKKIENKLTQAMAERTRQEILAKQKFEERKIKAKTLAEEKIASAKVRGAAIRSGNMRAELGAKSKKLNWRW